MRTITAAAGLNTLFSILNRTFTAGGESSGKLTFTDRELALYVHFPFCDAVCRYCPFSRSADLRDMNRYMDALLTELNALHHSGALAGSRISSLSFGGGTPSLIPDNRLRELMQAVESIFPESRSVQKTMECTAESITAERLSFFEEIGFNRLTIGVQSLQQSVLTELGRSGSPASIREKLALTAESWHGTWSCDMIYGFDSHTAEQFLDDLAELADLGSHHISIFPLVNSDHGRFGPISAQRLSRQNRMHREASQLLTSKGFFASSVEDYSRSESAECHYQKDVWEYPQKDLLILGSSAFGISGGVQYRKVKNRKAYIERSAEFPVDRYLPINPRRAEIVRPLMGFHYNRTEASRRSVLFSLLKLLGICSGSFPHYELTERGRFTTSLLWAQIMVKRMHS